MRVKIVFFQQRIRRYSFSLHSLPQGRVAYHGIYSFIPLCLEKFRLHMLEHSTIISVCGGVQKEGCSVDANKIRECIVRLNEEIEEVLQKAGYPKSIIFSPNRGADAEMETEDVLPT